MRSTTTESARVYRFPDRHTPDGQLVEAWITGPELASLLDIRSLRTLDNWRGLGMPSGKFGRARRYQYTQVLAWLNVRAQQQANGGQR